VNELEQEGVLSNVAVELMDNDLSSVYAATARAQVSYGTFLTCSHARKTHSLKKLPSFQLHFSLLL